MATREAACSCGQLRLTAEGDPTRISMCHCLACRRTGSAFGIQARFTSDQVHVVGRYSDYVRISDESDAREHLFHFCPECGATVFYTSPTEPDLVAVPVGAFADPTFPPPTMSVYNSRRHRWLDLPAAIELGGDELWAPLALLYERREYAEAADRGRALLEEHAEYGDLFYSVACCESLAGRTTDALVHLRTAIELSEQFRAYATDDSDFDPIREETAFNELVGSS